MSVFSSLEEFSDDCFWDFVLLGVSHGLLVFFLLVGFVILYNDDDDGTMGDLFWCNSSATPRCRELLREDCEGDDGHEMVCGGLLVLWIASERRELGVRIQSSEVLFLDWLPMVLSGG